MEISFSGYGKVVLLTGFRDDQNSGKVIFVTWKDSIVNKDQSVKAKEVVREFVVN